MYIDMYNICAYNTAAQRAAKVNDNTIYCYYRAEIKYRKSKNA